MQDGFGPTGVGPDRVDAGRGECGVAGGKDGVVGVGLGDQGRELIHSWLVRCLLLPTQGMSRYHRYMR